jgi:hypothetical protein
MSTLRERVGIADTRQHQQLRGIDRSAAEDDLAARPRRCRAAGHRVLHGGGPGVLDADPRHLGTRLHGEIAAAAGRVEVGARGAHPHSAPLTHHGLGDALALVVVDPRHPDLLSAGEKVRGVRSRAALLLGVHRGLGSGEEGLQGLPRPLGARCGGPGVVVLRESANPHHRVDG